MRIQALLAAGLMVAFAACSGNNPTSPTSGGTGTGGGYSGGGGGTGSGTGSGTGGGTSTGAGSTGAGAGGAGQGNGHGVKQARMCVVTVQSQDDAAPIARYTTTCDQASRRLR